MNGDGSTPGGATVATQAQARLVSRRALVSSSILVAENVLRLGLVAAVSLWIAHELGPAQFGMLNHASAVVAMFWMVALLGLDTPLAGRLTTSNQPGLELGSAIALRVITGLVGGVVACIAVLLFRHDQPLSVLLTCIVALSVPLSAPFVIDAWFKARNQALAPALARLGATLLACSAKAACLMLGLGVVALAWTVALEALLMSVALAVAFALAARGDVRQRLAVQRNRMRELLHLSWPYLVTTFAVSAYSKVDVVLLGMLSTDEQTGLYSLGQKLCEVLYLLPMIVVDVLFPQLVRQNAAGATGAPSEPQLFFDMAVAVAIIGTVLALLVVGLALPVLFGDPYRPTVGLFYVQAWACIAVALAYARYKWLAATGLQRLAPRVTLLGLLMAVAFNLVLIPQFGAMGAAVATLAAFFGSGYLLSFAFPELRPAARMQTRALWPWGRLWGEWRQWRLAVAVQER